MDDAKGSAPAGNLETTTATTESAKAATPPATATQPIGWDSDLAPELRTAIAPKGWKSKDDAIKSYLDLERKITSKGVLLPGKDATPEDVQAFRTAMGVPPSPDKYDTAEFGEGYDQNRIKLLLPIAHKIGVPAPMLKELVKEVNAAERAEAVRLLTERKAKDDRELQGLKDKWGTEFEAKSAGIRQAAVRLNLFTDADLNTLEGSVGTTRMLTFLDHIFGLVGDEEVAGTGSLGTFGVTPQTADAELKRMQSDPETAKALSNKGHKDHKDVVARWNRLLEVKTGTKAPA